MSNEEAGKQEFSWVGLLIVGLLIVVLGISMVLLLPESSKGWLTDFIYWIPGLAKATP